MSSNKDINLKKGVNHVPKIVDKIGKGIHDGLDDIGKGVADVAGDIGKGVANVAGDIGKGIHDGLDDIFGTGPCHGGIPSPFGGWIRHPGKYYKKCGCPNGVKKCPSGYFSTFDNLYDEKNNPISQSIIKSGFKGKSCGEIAGRFPDSSKWNKALFTQCVNFKNFQTNIDNNLKNLKPIHTIYNNRNTKMANIEKFTTKQESSLYNTVNGVPNRMISFNNQLQNKIKNDYNFLHSQAKSTELLRNSNTEWKTMMDQMHDVDKEITNQMQVKTRLVEINNEEARNKNHKIMVILGAFSSLFIALLGWVGYMSGNISINTMFGMFGLAAIVFIIIAIGLNKYAWKKFKKYSDKLEKEIIREGDKLNLDALQWVDDNCDCPDDNKKKKQVYVSSGDMNGSSNYNKMMEHNNYEDDSIYYNDGTTKHKISSSDFAKETGYLPSDIQDKLETSEFVKNKQRFNNVVNNLVK